MANSKMKPEFAERIKKGIDEEAYEKKLQRIRGKIAAHKGYGLPKTQDGKEKENAR